MKDIVITSKKIKRERNIYILCFVLAFIINIIAIIVYARPWVEMFSQIGGRLASDSGPRKFTCQV